MLLLHLLDHLLVLEVLFPLLLLCVPFLLENQGPRRYPEGLEGLLYQGILLSPSVPQALCSRKEIINIELNAIKLNKKTDMLCSYCTQENMLNILTDLPGRHMNFSGNFKPVLFLICNKKIDQLKDII